MVLLNCENIIISVGCNFAPMFDQPQSAVQVGNCFAILMSQSPSSVTVLLVVNRSLNCVIWRVCVTCSFNCVRCQITVVEPSINFFLDGTE